MKYYIPFFLILIGCTTTKEYLSHLTRRTASDSELIQGTIVVKKATDLESDKSIDEQNKPCSFQILSKELDLEAGSNCYRYKVKSSFHDQEVMLTSDKIEQSSTTCLNDASSQQLPPNPTNPDAAFISYHLTYDENQKAQQFVISESYVFSAVATICKATN